MTKDLYSAFGSFCAVLLAAATSTAATSAPAVASVAPDRGALVRAERSAHMSGEQVAKYLLQAGLPRVKGGKGVDIYSVTYRTIDQRGRPTVASASLDLLKAAKTLAERRKITLDSRILVTGFSQGGHTAMALGAALQRDPELDVAAIAPVSGPFDLEHAELPATLDGRLDERVATFYLA
jgi:fermentation-respiration switch protein FrsA (DUF1100 family)